jgi:hypothetical protein
VRRLHQSVLIGSAIAGAWLGMQAVHEFGHVLGAWATGGDVSRVVLHPLTISRTDIAHTPHPLVVVWSGPVAGVALPLMLWAVAAAVGLRGSYMLRFFAGFCLLGNGLYIGAASFARVGDCGDLLRHGAELWQLWLFGAVTASIGLALWHGLGAHFGLGSANGHVDHRVAYATLIACLALVALGLYVGGR